MKLEEFLQKRNLKELAESNSIGCPLMKGKDKIKTDELLVWQKKHKNKLVLSECAVVSIKDTKTGDDKQVAVVTIEGLDDRYYMGGEAMSRMICGMRKDAIEMGLDSDELGLLVNGMKIRLEKIDLPNGNTFVDVMVVSGDV